MPNYSSSSVNTVDWAMGFDGYSSTVKKRNLLENLHISNDTQICHTPTPPPYQDFLKINNSKQQIYSNRNENNPLPHQTSLSLLDHINYKYSKIRARPIDNFTYNQRNIWTQSSSNRTSPILNNLLTNVNIVNKFFVKETKSNSTNEQRSRSSSLSKITTQPFRILDKSCQIAADVAMRYLLQLLAKCNDQVLTINDVFHGIETGNINHEWLQCVQRLNTIITKQFEKRPEIKQEFENYSIENINNLNHVEQFFFKLLRIPNYSFKLKFYQYRDELQIQLNLLNETIDRFIHGIELILNHKYLPDVFQMLCFLYNILSNKCVPGLDLISLVDALNSPTNRVNTKVAHVLVQILDEHYQNDLFVLINDQNLIDLKKLQSIKYQQIYCEIREIYQQYRNLEFEYSLFKNQYPLPSFMQTTFNEGKIQFEKLFQQECLIKQGEEKLAIYFCSYDLPINICLSIVGQFIDKLRLAYIENKNIEKQRYSIINYPHRQTQLFSMKTNASCLPCI